MSKVYFTSDLSSESLVKMYKVLDKELNGNIAIKIHTGEKGNQNYLRPDYVKDLVELVNGTIVECNTAYEGQRNTTYKHKQLVNDHEWTKYFKVDIMDETDDIKLEIKNGKIIKENYVGKNIQNYDSMLVISHFKGHPMGGYGGALKQLSIGCASTKGKCIIHSAGKVDNQKELWDNILKQELFLESMVDAASSIIDYFKGNIVYINVVKNISIDCDCCKTAEAPMYERYWNII